MRYNLLRHNNEIDNNTSTSTLEVLQNVLEDPTLSLLHSACNEISYIIKQVTNLAPSTPASAYKEEKSIANKNQLRIDDKFYYINEAELDVLYKQSALNNKTHFKKKKNILRNIIVHGLSEIENKKSSSKLLHIFKALSQYDNLKYFIHDYFQHLFILNKNTKKGAENINHKLKLTATCINFSQTLIRFVIAQIPVLNCIYHCFNHVNVLYLKSTDINFIIAFVPLIFEKDVKEKLIKQFFNNQKIDNKHIIDLVMDHFKELFISNNLKNTIYNDDIKKIIAHYVKDYKDPKLFLKESNAMHVSLGYYWISLMITDDGFSIVDEHIPKKNKSIKMLEPSEALLEDLFLNNVHQKPYLEENQIHTKPYEPLSNKDIIDTNVKKLIHENMKIDISLKKECYLHNTTQTTKLSVHLEVFKGYLMELCNKTKTRDEWLAILDVDKNYITELKNIHCFIDYIIEKVIEPAVFNFTDRISSAHLKKQIEVCYQKVISNSSSHPEELQRNNISLDTVILCYKQYKTRLFELCDKCCQRKNEHVDYVIQCIYYSIYKYFLTTIFIDARSRLYMYIVHLNILTNPSAKMFVNLYDPNEGKSIPPKALLLLQGLFKFPQTREKIRLLQKKTKNELKTINIQKIHEYILNFLNISMEALQNLITNDTYYGYRALMTYLLPFIKKSKRLHYVHSMILYEQARHRNIHCPLICNYYEKDGSSSGYQVMAGVFNNERLGIMANLIGPEDFKLYSKATRSTYNGYKNMLLFTKGVLDLFNSNDILELHHAGFDLSYSSFTQDDFMSAVSADSLETLLTLLIKVDFKTSSIITDILHVISLRLDTFMKSDKLHNTEHIPYIFELLPKAYHDIYNKLKRKLIFENLQDALKATLCLRFSVRICYISERILRISHNDVSLWNERDLSKDAIMTRLYGSTAYGRKTKIIDKLKDRFLMPTETEYLLEEFGSFLQKSINKFLDEQTNIRILDEFADSVCSDKEIIIENRNFIVTLNPTKAEDFQVSCSTFSGRRGSQLVIKKFSSDIDEEKLRSMFLANFAHTMDADIMHHFCEIVLSANEWLKNAGIEFILAYERNHDCFFIICPILLEIFVEEAYLRFFSQNNIKNIKNINPQIIEQFQEKTPEEFLKLLNPICPSFIK